jgi:hypothetical protein
MIAGKSVRLRLAKTASTVCALITLGSYSRLALCMLAPWRPQQRNIRDSGAPVGRDGLSYSSPRWYSYPRRTLSKRMFMTRQARRAELPALRLPTCPARGKRPLTMARLTARSARRSSTPAPSSFRLPCFCIYHSGGIKRSPWSSGSRRLQAWPPIIGKAARHHVSDLQIRERRAGVRRRAHHLSSWPRLRGPRPYPEFTNVASDLFQQWHSRIPKSRARCWPRL